MSRDDIQNSYKFLLLLVASIRLSDLMSKISNANFRTTVYSNLCTVKDGFRLIACTTFSMSNGTLMGKHSPVYERLLYRNDVCLTDCVFLCILSAAFGILWLDLDLWCKSQLYFSKLFLHFYIYILASHRVLSWFMKTPRDRALLCIRHF